MNRKILVSSAQYFSLEKHINPYYGDNSVDRNLATFEHQKIVEAFKGAGIEIVQVGAPEGCQDGVYTANWALVHNGHAVLSRLPNARKNEEAYAEKVLNGLGIITHKVPEDWLFSGQGDSLVCGNFLFAGSGYRSDKRAQRFAAETLGLALVQLHAVPEIENSKEVINAASGLPDSFFYDLDLALAVVDSRTIAYCPEAFDDGSLQEIREMPVEKIEVSLEEAQKGFGLNMVSTGRDIIMSADAPIFATELENRGLKVHRMHIEELKKGGGFIRCVSLTLD